MAPNQLQGTALSWLLEEDTPSVRYLALRDLLEHPSEDAALSAARRTAHRAGSIAEVLNAMQPEGYWVEGGAGYNPKYRSGVWSLLMLAQLGASLEEDERIARACHYMLDQALTAGGQFSTNGAPSGTADCLQGNLCWALTTLGCLDARLDTAYEWMARSVTGEGVAPFEDKKEAVRYYAGKCAPNFACGSNDKLPCAWGAVKVLLAFGVLPAQKRTPLIQRAILQGIDFIFSVDPATAAYPNGYAEKPSQNWWKFGFPVFYITDLLQIVEALAALGYGRDPRLQHALDIVRQKQDHAGRWLLEYSYEDKTWMNFGDKKVPNKWVTLRALRALKRVDS